MKRIVTILTVALALYSTSLTAKPQESKPITELAADLQAKELISQEEEAILVRLAKKLKANKEQKIQIVGSSDSKGARSIENRYAYIKALYIRELLKEQNLDPEQITLVGTRLDNAITPSDRVRKIEIYSSECEVVTVVAPAKAKAKTTSTSTSASASASATATSPATSTATAPASVTAESTSTSTATSPAAVTTTSSSTTSSTSAESTKIAKEKTPFSWSEQLDYLYVRTNLLYFMGGLFNVGVEYKRPESDFGFLLNGGYSPFSNDSWDKNLGGWFVSPEVRYYIPKNDSWFVGAQLLYGGYNIKLAEGKPGRQGNVLCLGAMGGYKLAISQRLAMDFTLGLGYAKLDYDSYNVVQGRNISLDKNITKNSFLPIQGGINLIYKIK